MSDSGQPKTPKPDGADVPRLVDSYRSHREALHSRVQELVNLREQIRAAAAQEATEIVDGARRDVRTILVKARRELLVLTAQVQAATDERPRALEESSGGASQRDRVLAEAARSGLALEREDLGAARDLLVGARQGVQQILESARPDLEALDAEMRLLRSGAGQAPSEKAPDTFNEDLNQLRDESSAFRPDPATTFRPDPPDRLIDLSLSEEAPPASRFALLPRVAVFVAAFGVLGIIVMIGTTWWRSSPAAAVAPAEEAAVAADLGAPPVDADAAAAPVDPAAPVSVRLQAVRDVWLRTTIDGQADAGRLLRAGETRNVSAAGDVSIRIGDAGALLVAVNGGALTSAGPSGQVVTRVFSRQPARPPAAEATQPALVDAPPLERSARNVTPAPASEPPPVVATEPPAPRAAAQPPTPSAAPPSPVVPAPPAAGRASAAAPAAGAAASRAANTDAAEGELVPAAQRWFSLYYQGDHLTAGGDAPNVTDDRGQGEKPPTGASVTQRVFDEVRVQLVGDNALYTARMTERVQAGTAASQFVSLVSQVWMRRSGMWRLVDVRLVSAGRLNSQATP